jgi:phage-related protein
VVQPPQSWTLHEYATPGGEKPVLGFLQRLEGRNKRDAIALIQLLRERGNQLRPPHSKAVETGLFELRGHQVRIFYMFRPGRRIVLLDGMVKKQDEIPSEVLQRVRGYRQAVEATGKKSAQEP